MEMEYDAYDELLEKWEHIPISIQQYCSRSMQSFTILDACIDLELEAKIKNKQYKKPQSRVDTSVELKSGLAMHAPEIHAEMVQAEEKHLFDDEGKIKGVHYVDGYSEKSDLFNLGGLTIFVLIIFLSLIHI